MARYLPVFPECYFHDHGLISLRYGSPGRVWLGGGSIYLLDFDHSRDFGTRFYGAGSYGAALYPLISVSGLSLQNLVVLSSAVYLHLLLAFDTRTHSGRIGNDTHSIHSAQFKRRF